MLKIAICGNIASGKSTVQDMLKEMGYNVIDTDVIAADLRVSRKDEIIKAYEGFDIVDEDGNISRQKLSKIIFGNEELLGRLAELMHPWIREVVLDYFDRHSNENAVFVGIPLLFEANMQDDYDKIIFVYTDDDIRLNRLLTRNNYTLEHAKERLACQIPQEEKINKCDFVLNNNGSVEDLEYQVKELLAKLHV